MQRKCTFYSSRVVGCVYPGRFHLLIYPRLLISRRYANDKRGFFLDYRERARHRLEYRRKKWCHRSGTPCIFSYITPIDTRASHSYPSVSFSFLFLFFFLSRCLGKIWFLRNDVRVDGDIRRHNRLYVRLLLKVVQKCAKSNIAHPSSNRMRINREKYYGQNLIVCINIILMLKLKRYSCLYGILPNSRDFSTESTHNEQ